MKKAQRILFIALAFFMTTSLLQAQRGGDRNMSVEDRTKKEVERLSENLALSDAQKTKIYDTSLEYNKKMMEARANARNNPDADRNEIRTLMGKVLAEKNESIKKYLTADQVATLDTHQKERMAEREQRMNGKRGEHGEKGKRKRKGEHKDGDDKMQKHKDHDNDGEDHR